MPADPISIANRRLARSKPGLRHSTDRPFRLSPPKGSAWQAQILKMLGTAAEGVLAFPALNDIYERTRALAAGGQPFADRALQVLRVSCDVTHAELAKIPPTGPCVVVANHPFGGLDGLLLASILQRVRPDIRLLVNHLLHVMPEMGEISFFVDPFGGAGATARNRSSMRAAIEWVRGGGLLGVFPAGEVSHFDLGRRSITDPPWSSTVARIVRLARANVVPVYFHGANSRLFQILGLVHPRLRTIMLPHELLRKQKRRVHVEIGNVIAFSRLERFEQISDLCDYLRVRTYLLRERVAASDPGTMAVGAAGRVNEPIVEAKPPEVLAGEVARLPDSQRLVSSGCFEVLYARAEQIPHVMHEIGRLRELTFRKVGEATGRSIDLDPFDRTYVHLFVWHAQSHQIVGAYRLGPTDEIAVKSGISGLYTSTLFQFKRRLLDQIGPALELGRSFVVEEYQRNYAPLLMLWRGIGTYVSRNPRYRMLFGAVSISDEFHSSTKQLLMSFLKTTSFRTPLARWVQARNPPKRMRLRGDDQRMLAIAVKDVADADELVREIESDRREMPVLLRQYLRLNARLLGFNVDADFGSVLDALLLVDLAKVERRILDRYFGREDAGAFLAHHGISQACQEPDRAV